MVQGNESIKNATSILDYIFRDRHKSLWCSQAGRQSNRRVWMQALAMLQ